MSSRDAGADADVKPRSLLPREHGAYAEAGFPLVTGLVMSRADPAAILFSVAAIALFLMHEPLLVYFGHRGKRAQRDHGGRARRRAVVLALSGVVCGLVAVGLAPQDASMWLFIPAVLGAMMMPRIFGGTMKTLLGELLAGVALAAMLLPVGLAGGVVPLPIVAVGTGAWALTFVMGTLAVRAITRPHERRAEGEEVPPSMGPGSLRGRLDRNTERTVLLLVSGWTVIGIVLALLLLRVSPFAVLAAAPGAIAGLVLGIKKISVRHIREVGWVLVGVYTLALGLLVTASFTF
jgi:hypothetical protein